MWVVQWVFTGPGPQSADSNFHYIYQRCTINKSRAHVNCDITKLPPWICKDLHTCSTLRTACCPTDVKGFFFTVCNVKHMQGICKLMALVRVFLFLRQMFSSDLLPNVAPHCFFSPISRPPFFRPLPTQNYSFLLCKSKLATPGCIFLWRWPIIALLGIFFLKPTIYSKS